MAVISLGTAGYWLMEVTVAQEQADEALRLIRREFHGAPLTPETGVTIEAFLMAAGIDCGVAYVSKRQEGPLPPGRLEGFFFREGTCG